MSEVKKFTIAQIPTEDRDIIKLRDYAQTVFDSISKIPFIDGVKLTGVALAVGDNFIEHKLSRLVRGYFILICNTAYSIYSDKEQNTETHLHINSDVAAIADIWVF